VSRRSAERHPKRVEVRFWKQGDAKPHSGFSIDVSKTGLFLGTSTSLQPGERLRLELLDRERGFVIEGRVARVHRVSGALRQLDQPGAGVRFLSPAELVSDLVVGTRPKPSAPSSAALRIPPGAQGGERSPETAPARSATAATPPAPAATAAARPLAPARTFAVEFVDRSAFLSVFERDIAAGGLFIGAEAPVVLYGDNNNWFAAYGLWLLEIYGHENVR
jgi:hypothetical protein